MSDSKTSIEPLPPGHPFRALQRIRPPRAVETWWSDPDRELMRREITWAWGWLTGPGRWWLYLWGLGWLFRIVIAFTSINNFLFAWVQPALGLPIFQGTIGGYLFSIVQSAYIFAVMPSRFVPVVLWYCFIYWRTLAILNRPRLPDLLVSPANLRRTIAQSMAAPLALQLGAIGAAFLIRLCMALARRAIDLPLPAAIWQWALVDLSYIAMSLPGSILAAALEANVILLFAASTRSALRIACAVVACWAFHQLSLYFVGFFLCFVLPGSWGSSQTTLWFVNAMSTLVSLALVAAAWRLTFRRLMSAAFEEKLRAAAERAG